MNKRLCLLIAVLLTAGLQPVAARQISAQGEKLLAAAQHKATIDGDLKGAIEDYRKIVTGAGANRALAAQALVQMAECYQKLGDVESSRIYERVVREYADQADAVSVARARLGRIKSAAGESGIVTRQVWTGPKVDPGLVGTVTADGRLVSFVDWSTGNIALHDLATGSDRPLTNKRTFMESPLEFGQETAISPDGRQVAYAWHTKDLLWDLRVVGTAGAASAPPRVVPADGTIASIAPYAWSPDGRWIAVQFTRTDRTRHIGLVNASDGTLRTLKSAVRRGSSRLFFSPDGKYLAFDLPSGDTGEQRDVFVVAADGSRDVPAVVHTADDVAVGWTPDGRHLLFASDRGGSKGLWALPWAEEKPRGEPELIKTDINLAEPMGITRSGALYYGVTLSEREVYVAELDAISGRILAPPTRPIEQFVGTNHSPDWSPDGKSLAYVSRTAILVIRSMDTGQTREFRPGLKSIFLPRWSPDGRSIAVLSVDDQGRRGIHRVDATTGATSPILQVPPGHVLWGLDWTPDSRKLVFRDMEQGGTAAVIEYHIESGTQRELVRGGVASLTLSPDGRYLAYVADAGLMVLPIAGGQPRAVPLEGLKRGPGMVIAWTPDSRAILFGAATTTEEPPGLWLVSPDGSQLRKVDLPLRTTVAPLRFNPRTNQIAVTANTSRREVWVLEHFLPGAKAPATRRQDR